MVYLLLGVFSFVALAPLCSVAWRLIDGNREALKTSQQEYQLLLASTISRELDIHLEGLRAQLVRGTHSLALACGRAEGAGDDAVRLVLAEVVDERMRYLRFTDLRGHVVNSSGTATIPEELEPTLRAGFRAMAESLADQRQTGTGDATHADPLLLSGNPRRAALVLTAPVISGGRFRGVVSALVDLQSVWDAVVAGHSKEPHALFAVDTKGRLFAAKNLPGVDPGRDMADSEIVKRFRDHPGRATETMPFDWAPRRTDPRERYLGSYEVSHEGWGVFVQATERQFYQPVSKMIESTVEWGVASLLGFRDHPFRRAGDGAHGTGKEAHGKTGTDTVVNVPIGTVVKDPHGEVLADLAAEGHRWLIARGGRGGRGNASFLSNRRRAPDFAEQGEVGEEQWCNLELKLMADVALVGFPNAGKSTLISTVSAAKPKVADYPFTTLEPHLGVVRLHRFGTALDPRGDFDFVMADIPGLIEGASEGRGLGHQFLRHIERARVLLVLVDLSAPDDLPPRRQEEILLNELGAYRPELLARPRIVVGTKLDAIGAGGASREELLSLVPDAPELCISAVAGIGLRELLTRVAPLIAGARAEQPDAATYVVHRPEEEGVRIDRADDASWIVVGRMAQRAVAVSDINNSQALAHVHNELRRLGVDRALARAGARPGDVVRIGTFTFEYE